MNSYKVYLEKTKRDKINASLKKENAILRSAKYDLTAECTRLQQQSEIDHQLIKGVLNGTKILQQKINDLNTQNNINSDVIFLRDNEIELLTDQEAKYKSEIKNLKKKIKSLKKESKSSMTNGQFDKFCGQILWSVNKINEQNENEKKNLSLKIDELEKQNEQMRVKHQKEKNKMISDQNKELKAKDKVISKLEEKISKLKEKFISFKEKLRSKYSNSKREKKVLSKNKENNEEFNEQNLPAEEKNVLKFKNSCIGEEGERTKRILKLLN